MNDPAIDYVHRHPRSRDPERMSRLELEVERLRAAGVPMGGTPHTGFGHNVKDAPYPLVCVCDEPDPEWVYVAHQCRHCRRLIQAERQPCDCNPASATGHRGDCAQWTWTATTP